MKKRNIILSSLRGADKATWQSIWVGKDFGLPRFARNDGQLENGNALFFILIAIALLGLLTVTMTNSSSNTNDTGDFEQNQIAANEILGYAKSIESAVQQLMARGCGENEISFENSTVPDYTNTTPSPADNSCHIFDVAGTGLRYQIPNENWLDTTLTAQVRYGEYVFSGAQKIIDLETPRNELVIYLPYIKLDLCQSINNTLGVNNPPPQDTFAGAVFIGAYADSPDPDIGDEDTSLENTPIFCNAYGANGPYGLVYTLHAR